MSDAARDDRLRRARIESGRRLGGGGGEKNSRYKRKCDVSHDHLHVMPAQAGIPVTQVQHCALTWTPRLRWGDETFNDASTN
jgi:hypothetical protein